MDGVGISIIERPRPLPGHDTPNPTEHPYTLKCEEPVIFERCSVRRTQMSMPLLTVSFVDHGGR